MIPEHRQFAKAVDYLREVAKCLRIRGMSLPCGVFEDLLDNLTWCEELSLARPPSPMTLNFSVFARKVRLYCPKKTRYWRRPFRVFRRSSAVDTRFPFILFVSQAETEDVLSESLRASGVVIERGTELVSFEREDDNLVAQRRELIRYMVI